MFILFTAIAMVFGLYVGSFVTATSLRVANGEKVFAVRSKCDQCGQVIGMLYLVPVLGYLVCKGKCVHCNKKVSFEYSIWEMIHAGLYMINFIMLKDNIFAFICMCGIASILMMISIIDIKTMYIYDIHIIILFIFSLLLFYTKGRLEVTAMSFISAVIPLLFKVLYEYGRKLIIGVKMEVLGMGDVKLLIIPFFLLDFYKTAVMMAIAGLMGVLYSGVLRGRKGKIHYPFAPSISISMYGLFVCLL